MDEKRPADLGPLTDRTDDQPATPAGSAVTTTLSAEAATVVAAASELINSLKRGDTHGVFGQVLDLKWVLADLEAIERRKYEQRQTEAIDRAAGAALTHTWQLVDSGLSCARCPVDAGSRALERGTVPECGQDIHRAPFARRHLIVTDQCTYCDTVYPSTAEPPADRGQQ